MSTMINANYVYSGPERYWKVLFQN